MAVIPAIIFGRAITSFVGQNIGSKNFERVKQGVKVTLLQSGSISIILTLLIIFSGNHLIRLFNTDEEVIRIGKQYLVIVSSFYILFATMFVYLGALRGAGDTLIPMFMTFFSLWVIRIPIAYFLSKEIGKNGIWWSLPIAWFIGLILAYIYFQTGNWKFKGIVDNYVD